MDAVSVAVIIGVHGWGRGVRCEDGGRVVGEVERTRKSAVEVMW